MKLKVEVFVIFHREVTRQYAVRLLEPTVSTELSEIDVPGQIDVRRIDLRQLREMAASTATTTPRRISS